jgi:hypothetical protein
MPSVATFEELIKEIGANTRYLAALERAVRDLIAALGCLPDNRGFLRSEN